MIREGIGTGIPIFICYASYVSVVKLRIQPFVCYMTEPCMYGHRVPRKPDPEPREGGLPPTGLTASVTSPTA